MIDVHMIDSGKFPDNFALQADRVRHPLVKLQVAQPVWGNIADARRRAYALGDSPYVSWIDDDDEVLDIKWVDRAIAILESDASVSAVYPRWCSRGELTLETPCQDWQLIGAHNCLQPFAHHLTVMRREHVAPFFADVGDRALLRDQDILLVASMARYGRLVALPDMAYCWVLREGTSRTYREPRDLNQWGLKHWENTVRAHLSLSSTQG